MVFHKAVNTKRAIRFFERLIALVLKFLNLMSAFAFHNFFYNYPYG